VCIMKDSIVMNNFGHKLTGFFASKKFFYIVLGFFVLEALWFVFSALYPMAFDEDFHLGVIRIYSEQWLPFLSAHPEGADQFGAITRDPSYFFHYLMSFPYRLIESFTQSEAIQVILLRLINVSLFIWSLVLFRRVLLKAKASPALVNVSIAVFVLIPIVPQLAAHINYDNLLMVLIAWLCLVTFRLVDSFRERRVDMAALFTFVIICLFTSVVKYAALPLLAAAALFVAYMAYHNFKGYGKRLRMRIKDGYLRIGRRTKILLLLTLLLSSLLFAQRYVVNLLDYQHPVPDCGKVLSVEQCTQYGPWGRDYKLEQSRPDDFKASPLTFMGSWIEGMRHRLFFAVSGAKTLFNNYIELPVPVLTFSALVIAGLVAIIVWWRQIFRGHDFLAFFLFMTIIYSAVLWYDQYSMYKQTGVAVAINGRYLLPVLLPMAAVAGRAFAIGLAKCRRTPLKPYIAAVAILFFLNGGGVFTFILRSDDSWYWPNQFVKNANHAARNIIAPAVIEGDKYADWHDQIY
jgi:hypothetical protein